MGNEGFDRETGTDNTHLPADLSPARLMEVAATDPSRWAEIAAHPAAYPDLLDWLASNGDQHVRSVIAQRRQAPASSPTVALDPIGVDAPVAYPAPRARTSPLAIASFALSFFAAIVSIVLGHLALGRIRRTGERGRVLALAGLWISYTAIASGIAVVAVMASMGLIGLDHVGPAAAPAAAPSKSQPQTSPAPSPTAVASAPVPSSIPSQPTATATSGGAVPPAPSGPVADADRAYCQNRGTLLQLAESATYRGALCIVNGLPTLIGRSRDVGGSVSLPATSTDSSFGAVAGDGTVYTYTQASVTIQTKDKTYQQSTTMWMSGTSPQLAAPGDLGLATKISYPACDDTAIVVYGTSWHPASDKQDVQKLLDANPGSSYLRTDLSCRSFAGPSTANSNGEYVYAVYTPAASASAACQAIAGTSGYGRWLSNTKEPADNNIAC